MFPYDEAGRLELCRARTAELAENYRRARPAARESKPTELRRLMSRVRALFGRDAAPASGALTTQEG